MPRNGPGPGAVTRTESIRAAVVRTVTLRSTGTARPPEAGATAIAGRGSAAWGPPPPEPLHAGSVATTARASVAAPARRVVLRFRVRSLVM